jgi:GntR family transcriptional regulator/MocR family aminotransferase
VPLYRDIYERLRQRIAVGGLPNGARLASSRALARELGVSRNTVVAAYEALAADGLLVTRHGSGTRVRAPRNPEKLNAGELLRQAHYPANAVPIADPDGHTIHLHR